MSDSDALVADSGSGMNPEELMRLYEAKYQLQRFDDLVPLISTDSSFWFIDGSYHGIDEIRAACEESWRKLPNAVLWLENVDWVAVSDSAASCTYRFRWKADIDGKVLEGGGRGTSVLRKEDTSWKIIHEHLSEVPR